MYSKREKAQCVLWYHETQSLKKVQQKFQTAYHRHPSDIKSIKMWYAKFKATGSVCDLPETSRPRPSAQTIQTVRDAFVRSPKKSVRKASRELQIPKTSVHCILHKQLLFRAYKVQIMQSLQPRDYSARYDFAVAKLAEIKEDDDYMKHVLFSDEATFHLNGVVNRHNARIWGSENPHAVFDTIRDSPKLNTWCGLMHNKFIGPFLFSGMTITANTYLDMLQ